MPPPEHSPLFRASGNAYYRSWLYGEGFAEMQELAPGGQFGAYGIVSVIGYGGMGVVYLAEDTGRLGRRVALKVLAHQYSTDAAFRARFERESRLAASLDHPNVVPVYEAGEVNGVLFIAMRYVEGPDLRTVLDTEGRFDAMRAIGICAQLASALDAAHAHGLIHRDVKPGNVLLAAGYGSDGGEHVYLTDFGLTKKSASKSGLTQLGQLVGTIDYIAPEQLTGIPVDGRADVYALGCVFFEMLAGKALFARETDLATMAAHLHEPPPSLTVIRTDLPPAIDQTVARVLAKDPELRFASAAEFVRQARRDLAEGQRVDVEPKGTDQTVIVPPPIPPDGVPRSPTVLTDTSVPQTGQPGAAAALAAAAASAATVLQPVQPPPPPVSGPPPSGPPPSGPPPYTPAPPPDGGPVYQGGYVPPSYPPAGPPPTSGSYPPPPPRPRSRVPMVLILAAVALGVLLVAGAAFAIISTPQATPTLIAQPPPSAAPTSLSPAGSSVAPTTSAPTPAPTPTHSLTSTPILTPTPTSTKTSTPRPTFATDPWADILDPSVISRDSCTIVDGDQDIFDNALTNLSCPFDLTSTKHVDRYYFLFDTRQHLDDMWALYHPNFDSIGDDEDVCTTAVKTFPHEWYYDVGTTIGRDACYYLDDGSPALDATYDHLNLYVVFIGGTSLAKDDVGRAWNLFDGVFPPS